MGLFSFFRKNKQEPASSGDSEFYSRAEEESTAISGRGKRKGNQTNDPVDPVLPEKKRARRRLVGAIALVLAAIIGLPMIFDSEPKPIADDITIQIPSKDKSVIKSIESRKPAEPDSAKPVASPGLDAKAETVGVSNNLADTVSTSTNVVLPKEAGKTADAAKPAGIEKTSVQAMVTVPSKADLKTEAKPEAKPVQKTSTKDPVSNASVSKSTTGKNTGKYALQVAALVKPEKINELQGKLKKAGFATYTQKVATESGTSTRIRVGPYASKEEADKARAKLIKMGLNGTPVATGH